MNIFQKLSNLFLTLIICSFAFSATAQVELYSSSATVMQGDRVQVDITTANFDELISLQFTLRWDSTVIDFVEITQIGLPDYSVANNFNTADTGSGILRTSWFDSSLQGHTVADSSIIFSIIYEVVGEPGDSTSVLITGNPTDIEAIGAGSDDPLEVNVFSGVISLERVNNISDFSQNILSLRQNFPNPFRESTIISANFAESTIATLHIFNNNGQGIYTHKQRYSAGDHAIFIDRKIFPETGIYWYQLETPTHSITKSLMYVK